MLADLGDRPDHRRVAREEGRPVTGHIRLFGQRIQAQEARDVAVAHPLVQDRRRLGNVPRKLGVALVAGDHDAALPRPREDRPQALHAEHVPVGVPRRVEPEHAHRGPRRRVGVRVHGHGLGASEARADVVRRIGGAGKADGVRGSQTEERGQQGHHFLRPDRGKHACLGAHAAASFKPSAYGRSQLGRSDRQRIAVGVGCGVQGRSRAGGDRIHRRADRQVHDAVRMRCGALPHRHERVPGEIRKLSAEESHHSPCGGSPATYGWSLPVGPKRWAPPGEPMSSKNSALTDSNTDHSSGRSSS